MGEPGNGIAKKQSDEFRVRLVAEMFKEFPNVDWNIAHEIDAELGRAKMHGTEFASAHEAHSVMLEELEEFWDHVKLKRKNRCGEAMRKELVQLAAMAVKAIQSMPNFVGGSV